MKQRDGDTTTQRQHLQLHRHDQQEPHHNPDVPHGDTSGVQHPTNTFPASTTGHLQADSSAEQTRNDASSSAAHAQRPSSSSSSSSSSKPNSSMGPASKPAGVGSGLHWHDAKYVVPAFAAVAAFTWLLRRARSHANSRSSKASMSRTRPKQQRSQQGEQQAVAAPPPPPPEPEFSRSLYASAFQLLTQDVPLAARPAALEGLTCVVAEHIPVQGAVQGCGIPSLWSQQPTAASPSSLTQKLLSKGVSIVGQGSSQPLNYPTAGTNLRNPAAPYRAAGGGATGAVAAVAQGDAQLAVGSDWLGSVRIPAACQGVSALVCTPGTYAPGGQGGAARASDQGAAAQQQQAQQEVGSQPSSADRASSGGSSFRSRRASDAGLECAGLAAAEFGVLRRVAEQLALPGASDLRGELTQVVVAEDLFALCEPDLEIGLLCMKRAVLQWAGPEQAGSVQLLPFLESNCRAWTNLAAAADASPLANVKAASGKALPPVLRAITYAAQLLYHHELAQRYGSIAAGGAAGSAAAGEGNGPVQESQPELELDASVRGALEAGGRVQQQELDQAWQLMQEVQGLLNTAVKHDVVVVVPCIPAPPPNVDVGSAALQSWLSRCHAFAALTSLGGVPSAVVPVGHLPNGGGPLSVALFGHSRSDQRLLTVAERLSVYAQAELQKIEQQHAGEAEAAAAAAAAEASKQQSGKGRKQQQQQQQLEQADPRRLAKAEKAKAQGNEAFRQQQYRQAIKAYSEAAKLDPTNPVYLSNRALCYLKVFSFEAAEADCNAVLAFPQLAPEHQAKALLRRGTARIHKSEVAAAAADFRQVLALEPNNRQAREELKALQQQQADMQAEQRKALAGRVSNHAALPSSSTLPYLPQGMYPAGQNREALLGDPAVAAAAGGGGDAGHEQIASLAALMQAGGLPVVLGDEGQPVVGPRGEPVIVGPGGQQMTVGPSGGVQPFKTRRKRGSGS